MDKIIKWCARLSCGHWTHGTAGSASALPLPGHPAHCSECHDWPSVAEVVDTIPLQDSSGRA